MAMRRMKSEEKRPPCPTHGSLADKLKAFVVRDRKLLEEATTDPPFIKVRKKNLYRDGLKGRPYIAWPCLAVS